MKKRPIDTVFITDEMMHMALLKETQEELLFSLEAVRYGSLEDFITFHVSVWPRDLKQPPYQFKVMEKARDLRNPYKVDFIIPIDDRENAPPYVLSIFSDDNKVDLKEWKFVITSKPVPVEHL